MATSQTTSKSILDTWADAQKKAIETFTEKTEKFTQDAFGGKSSETADYFKNWYDSQMAFFYKQQENTTGEKSSNPADLFNQWLNTQTEASKKNFEKATEWAKNFPTTNNNPFMASNPFASSNPFMASNPMTDGLKSQMEKAQETFQNWNQSLNNSFQEMAKNFSGSDKKDYFTNMFNNADTYTKMFQMYMPLMNSFKDKTFTPDMFKQYMNPNMFKEMMDKMFHFAPSNVQDMFNGFNTNMKDSFGKMGDWSKEQYNNMKSSFAANTPSFMNDPFNGFLEQYQTMYSNLQNASNPFAKMMTPGADKDKMEAAADLSNRMVTYNVRNSQMQYLMYTTGMKAMETLGTSLFDKVQSGEEIKDFMSFYTEFLNTMDKTYLELFQSDEFSKIQSEFSAMGMRLKKDIEVQMEKAMEGLPVVPRSEMDELYKTVYDLKKRMRSLEKELEAASKVKVEKAVVSEVKAEVKSEAKVEEKAATKKATKTA